MKPLASVLIVLLGGGILGVLMSTLPSYDSSLRPIAVHADAKGVGQGRLFAAELKGLTSADAISYAWAGTETVRDTSATFLVAELSVTALRKSLMIEAVWLGATGRRYSQSARVENAPRTLPSTWFQPGLHDTTRAVFELPEDEIPGGQLVLTARGNAILDSAVHLSAPATPPQKRDTLRLEP